MLKVVIAMICPRVFLNSESAHVLYTTESVSYTADARVTVEGSLDQPKRSSEVHFLRVPISNWILPRKHYVGFSRPLSL